MKTVIQFMNSLTGRAVRILLGLALIFVGLASIGGTLGTVVAVIGLLPIALGIWGHCILELIPGQAHGHSAAK